MKEDWTIPAMLEAQASRRPDHPFLLFEDLRLTFGEMRERVGRLATGLRSLRIGAGRTVAILLDNGPGFVETWFALARLGAIEVPLNPEQRGPNLEHMVGRSGAKVLICTAGHLEELARFTPAALRAFEVIVVEGPEDVAELVGGRRVYRLSDLYLDEGDLGPLPRPESICGIMYTSGTTGPSKGVLVSHHYDAFVGHGLARMAALDGQDVMYCCLPLFHQGGQADCVMPMLAVGGTVAITARFSASQWWPEIERFGATTFIGFATMLAILYERPPVAGEADTPARVGLVGHVLPDMQRPFEERFGLRLLNVYGMTEAENAIYPRDPDATPVGSMGVADSENFDVELLDANDEPVPAGAVGEICIRPKRPHIMMEGYHDMPVETLHAYRNLWFHTGDLARRDSDGFFFFVDRLKESIRRRGENISSTEVEHVLNSHPGVAESAVVGVPSELGEDEVMAFVLPSNEGVDVADLVRFASTQMAYFMIPRYVEVVDDVPRTQTNKIAKHELKRRGAGERTWDRAKTELRDLGRRRPSARSGTVIR